MVNDNEILALKGAYEHLQSLEVTVEYGPLRGYTPEHHTTAQRLWDDIINPAVTLVLQTEKKTPDGRHRALAASPWHAYFYLRAQHQYVYRAGRPLGIPTSHVGETGGEHLFFRGQRCATWDFRSSLSRADEATRLIETRAVVALTEYFRSMFVANEDIASNTGRCFAQHYGIATDLADVSCDPDIAIWFATHPLHCKCPAGEPNGVVRATSWAGQQHGVQTICLLAPPFVRNVYEQRGVFIDTSAANGLLTGKTILDIEFPRETIGGEFEVWRHNESLEVWPTPSEEERALVTWSRQVAVEATDPDDVRTKVAQAQKNNSLPDFWLARKLWDQEKHIEEWLSILDWILPATCVTGLPVSSGPQPMRYEVLDLKVKALVRANPTFFRAFTEASEDSDFSGFEVLREVLRIARSELAPDDHGAG